MRFAAHPEKPSAAVPSHLRAALLPVARKVFWWGDPSDWMDDKIRFVAQVMTFGDWNEAALVSKLLGEESFKQVIADPPPGVFDIKSWTYWHLRFNMTVPPLPKRNL